MRQLILIIGLFHSSISFSQKKHVIVLGFDGLSANALRTWQTPVFNSLMQSGAYSLYAEAVLPTSSSPNWASMINGATPDEHGIKSNSWKRKDIKDTSFCGRKKGKVYQTVFSVLRAQNKKAKIDCIHHWLDFARLTDKDAMSRLYLAASENIALNMATNSIKTRKPDFLFVHFDHVDHAGHKYGYMTEEYRKAVFKADKITGEVIKALKDADIYEQSIIIITSDHGGINKGHGGNTREEIEIPWIISGAGIKKNHKVAATVHQYDTAPTIAKLFGITVPSCWSGKAVEEIFE